MNFSYEFKPNKYITLKLERNKTVIYVNNEIFDQCKFLVLNIIKGEDLIDYQDNIKNIIYEVSTTSIDKQVKKIEKELEEKNNKFIISPKEEFWAHCSNIQAWIESDYDTRLLHRKLAFPLLKKLVESGDLKAKTKFKEEIALRFEQGIDNTRDYLIKEKFIQYLDKEEFWVLIPDETEILKRIELKLKINFNLYPSKSNILFETKEDKNQAGFTLKNNQIKKIGFYNSNFSEKTWNWLIEQLSGLNSIKWLYLKNNYLQIIPNSIGRIRTLQLLDLSNNQLKLLPDSIGRLKSLKNLSLNDNKIEKLPESLGNIESLKLLDLKNNQLELLPESIGKLKKLESLRLLNNKLKRLPDSICNLRSLKVLALNNNLLNKIPESTGYLENLETLFLDKNNLERIPESVLKLKKLEYISLNDNKINKTDQIIKRLKEKKIRISI